METFIKKYSNEQAILFYIHFAGEEAKRQIEVVGDSKVCLSVDKPIDGESMLYDQNLSELDLDTNDFISKQEFEKVWEENCNDNVS